MTFEGFTPEAIDFLWGIRMNNNRDWFMAHKQQYIDTLYEPMKALGQELFEPYWETPGLLLKVSRIYRDVRLHHPDPYKESLWLSIRKDCPWWGEQPCLFFDIHPDGIDYGFGLYGPKPQSMNVFRKELEARPEEFLSLIQKVEKDTGIPVTAQSYKRQKPCSVPEVQEYYQWKNCIQCIQEEAVGPEIFGSQLKDRVAEQFRHVMPLYEYFDRVLAEQ